MVMKILDLHQVILLHDNDSNNILIRVINDEKNFLLYPVDNYEAKLIQKKKIIFFLYKFILPVNPQDFLSKTFEILL